MDYLQLVGLIIEDQLTPESFIQLRGVNQIGAEEELCSLSPIARTYGSDPKPIFFFKSTDYPNLGQLFHCCKLFTFAKGGSPYKEDEISEYDTRKDHPYVQVAVYDVERKIFIAGLRFLPLYKGIPFDVSAMNSLFLPTEVFKKDFMPSTLELGQTFVLPDVNGGNHLLSAMAAMIILNKDSRYLCGKPTIEGRIPDTSKEIISAFAREAFNPIKNSDFNPKGDELFTIVDDVIAPELRSFQEIVDEYNEEVSSTGHDNIEYNSSLSVKEKRRITEKLLFYYGGALPPMFKFYSFLTEEKGIVCPSRAVINPAYTTRAWEFPILLDKTKVNSIHKKLLDYYIETLGDTEFVY